ncbi:hypothetical protein OIV83_000427 [Microbotryomycetes sp. JL201]|nr:hypothetical protein OIV83_000427 [Microbotryomycetes sp. JL201]
MTTATPSARRQQESRPSKTADPQRLYRSLHDQIDSGHFVNAIKTCARLLRIDGRDELALRTKVQLLIALDKHAQALRLLHDSAPAMDPNCQLIKAYCLYKMSRGSDAQEMIDSLASAERHDRPAKMLEAQIAYRQEEYERSRDEFEELANTVELSDDERKDSPEHQDLQTNIDACDAHIDFMSSVPSHLGSTTTPAIETLESAPVGPLIHSNPMFKTVPTSGAQQASTSMTRSSGGAAAASTGAPGKKPRKLPKKYDPTKEPDPWRWTKMKERPGMGELIQQRREKARGKNKERQALLTQGGYDSPAKAKQGSAAGAGGGGSKPGGAGAGANAGNKKKKKGKK